MEESNKDASTTGQRSYRINLRLTESEFKKLMILVDQTTHKTLSGYARKLLLGKPVRTIVHDVGKDKIVEELAMLRSELNALANNFNQVVRRIHKLDELPNKEFWLQNCERLQNDLLQKLAGLQTVHNKISDQWLQES